MNIKYKISNVHICKNGKCIKTNFLVAKGLTNDIILGNPFFIKIQPFQVTSLGITTTIDNQEIFFEYIEVPSIEKINLIEV